MAHSSVSGTAERLAEEAIPILDLGPYLAGEAGALDVLGREDHR
jgi:hypothetical protein